MTSDVRSGSVQKGELAPDFPIVLSSGKKCLLSDFRGRKNVVLFFYPKDFTFGCTREVCSFRDNYDELKKYDVELFGVSCDDEETHAKFIKKHNLPFPLISDKDKSIGKAYGTASRLGGLLPGMKRVTFVIDKQGVVRSVLYHELIVEKHVEGVLAVLKSVVDQGG